MNKVAVVSFLFLDHKNMRDHFRGNSRRFVIHVSENRLWFKLYYPDQRVSNNTGGASESGNDLTP